MQITNTLNNCIRILFNPRIESFKLFDFLIVKSLEERYLAQIIEIYEDKFDASQNVARLRLFYKIASNNEVMPYDKFTPGKECEILKVKPEEVENFINNDKKTFIFATNVKNSQGLSLQYDFFNKNAIILADKIENANAISLNLTKKLSSERHTVFIDFTGIVELEDAKTIKACKNFKMPLNFDTIDFVFDRCLNNASLEFQAAGFEIQNAIKVFAKKQTEGFIPFGAFLRVILEQYKATPYPELQLLLTKMKKYQMSDIFARNKKDYEALEAAIRENDITIIDLSGLDSIWQKAYVEYIISELKDDIYMVTRINEEVFDVDLINKIYNKKQNIKFVPNVSYNYSKLPSIIQYCKNYILLPSLYQRNDFLDANFALANLIANECIIFGESTDGFLYIARDYELEVQEKRKNYRKIALSLVSADDDIVIQSEEKISDSQKLIEELSELEEQSIKEHEELQEKESEQEQKLLDNSESKDEFVELVPEAGSVELPKEVETIKNIQEIKLSNEPIEQNSPIEEEQEAIEIPEEKSEQNIEEQPEIVIYNDNEEKTTETEVKQEENPSASMEDTEKHQNIVNVNPDEIEISDEELDFFEIAESSALLEQQENVVIGDVEYKVKSDDFENEVKEKEAPEVNLSENTDEEKSDIPENNINDVKEDNNEDDDLDLSEVASSAIDNSFEEIINSKKETDKPSFEIDENTTIQVDLNETEEDNLPIFKDEVKDEAKTEHQYKRGDIVFHKKYGKGTVIKTIQYEQRQLLQIDFEESGKKLLDPKVAEIQLEQ